MRFPIQLLPWLLLLATLLFAYLTRGILLPFLAGFAVAYLLDPVADRLVARGLERGVATALILGVFFLGGLGLAFLLWPPLHAQLLSLIQALPAVFAAVQETVQGLIETTNLELGRDIGRQAENALNTAVSRGLEAAGGMISGLLSSGLALLGLLSLFLISPVVAFYLVRDYDIIIAHIRDLVPQTQLPAVRAAAIDIDAVLSGFVRGQLTVMAAIAALVAAGYTAIGLNYGLLLGLLTGLLSFIPFVGMLFSAALGAAVGVAQWGVDWHLLLVLGVWGAVQIIESVLLTPRLLSRHVNLHPVWVLFALFAGSEIAGFVGVMLAVPAAAAIAVLVRHSLRHYRRKMEQEKVPSPATMAPPSPDTGDL